MTTRKLAEEEEVETRVPFLVMVQFEFTPRPKA